MASESEAGLPADTIRDMESAAPSQAALLRLRAYVMQGFNGSALAALEREKKHAEEEAANRAFTDTMRLATEEQLQDLRDELRRLDEASMAAMLEAEEEMRLAKIELEKIRERANVVTMPDGRKVRAYLDGDAVRDEGGNLIDFLKPEDLPAGNSRLAEVRAGIDRFDLSAEKYGEIVEYRDRLGAAEERLDQGPVGQEEYERIKRDIAEKPASVAAHAGAKDEAGASLMSDPSPPGRALVAGVKPATHFSAVAPGADATIVSPRDAPPPAPDLSQLIASAPPGLE